MFDYNIKMDHDIVGIHNPYSFTFVRALISRDADILEIEGLPRDVVRYSLNRGETTDIDLRLLLQRIFADRYKNPPSTEQKFIDVPIFTTNLKFTTKKWKDNKKKETITLSTFSGWLPIADSTENMKHMKGKRVAPPNVGKPYFSGYPQVDYYCTKINVNTDPLTISFWVERARLSITVGDDSFYPKEEITRIVDECGIFLRWRTRYGSWGYWLFSEDFERELKTKNRGSWNARYKEGAMERKHLGLEVTEEWRLTSSVPVLANEIEEVRDLYTSNEVYLYTGPREGMYFESNFFTQWERVEVMSGTVKFNEPSSTYDISVNIGRLRGETRKMT